MVILIVLSQIIHIFTCENNNKHTVYGKKTTVKPWAVNVRIAISALAYTCIRLLSGIYHLEKLSNISKVFCSAQIVSSSLKGV